MGAGPIDPQVSDAVALRGRVVTMDAARTVHDDAVLYARDGCITAVLPATAPPPAGFEDVAVASVRGTVFPGLIELHNHMPYDVLSLWPTPELYTNRDQWSGPSTPEYRQLISGPMGVLGRMPDVVPAIVRFVELRPLLGGTTTCQGVALASSSGIVSHFRGLVRNVESTRDPDLPPAATHIADVDATDAEHFLARISGSQKLILHLSEGSDAAAREHFEALHLPDGRWAISENLIGIHCVALTPEDFEIFAEHGGSMVWSPLSNLLLYGETADVAAARAAGVPVALGSDWAPSGSKNLLGELKVARVHADVAGLGLTDRDLVEMATCTPAAMLGWDAHLGSIEAGKRADLVVVNGRGGDPYRLLVDATEADLNLVMINGTARVGTPALMRRLGPVQEDVTVAGRTRSLNLHQDTADPSVAALSVRETIRRLRDALADLPAAQSRPRPAVGPADGPVLAVADVVDNHMSPRPHLPFEGRFTGPNLPEEDLPGLAARAPLPFLSLDLDPLTAVDNPDYYTALAASPNLPTPVRERLLALAP